MKLNEKIKRYRKIFELSQEQLAEKLNVSRQAITKWENGSGVPEISNLKEISDLFGVSVDYLLDDEQQIECPVLKEKIILEKNSFSNRYNYAIEYLKKNYSNNATIYGLTELGRDKGVLFNIIDILSLRVVSFAEWMAEKAIWFIIEKETQNLIVKVSKDYIEIRELSSVIDTNKFTFDNVKLIKLKNEI